MSVQGENGPDIFYFFFRWRDHTFEEQMVTESREGDRVVGVGEKFLYDVLVWKYKIDRD